MRVIARPLEGRYLRAGRFALGSRFVVAVAMAWSPLLPLTEAATIEPPRFARYGIATGLSQSSVTAIVQDQRGFLWVGTRYGLNRFDGYEFRVYLPDSEDPDTLADAAVTALAAQADGSIWIGFEGGGLARYDPPTARFVRVSGVDAVAALAVSRDGVVWVGGVQGLARVAQPTRGRYVLEMVADGAVTSLAAHANDGVWVGFKDGGLGWYRAAGATPRMSLGTLPPGKSVRALAAAADGGAWVGSDGPYYSRVDANGVVSSHHRLAADGTHDEPRLRAIVADVDGRVWLGGLAMGVVMHDPADDSQVAHRHRALDPNSLSHDDVFSLWRDDANSLWIGTLSGGLNRLGLEPSGLAHYWHQPGIASSLSHNTVTSFASDTRGTVLVGTDGGGLNTFDLENGSFSRIAIVDPSTTTAGVNRIWAAHLDQDGGTWVGTWGAGLMHRRSAGERFARVPTVAATLVSAFAEDATGLWVATSAGVYRLSRAGERLEHLLAAENATTLELGASGQLWIGTWASGLFVLDRHSGNLRRLALAPTMGSSAPGESVRALAAEPTGVLWVGTGVGLVRAEPEMGRLQRFGVRDGLPPGAVYGIEIDDAGILWLGTNAGLVRYDPRTGVATRYLPDDGVQDFEFNGGAHHRLADGRLLFGGLNGFNLIEPRAVRPTAMPRPAQLVDVLLANQPLLPVARDPASPLTVAAAEAEFLELGPRQNVFGIRFTSPLPVAPTQVRYAYRLDGFDSSWQVVDAEQRTAVYTNLPAGRYVFRVRAGNADGRWSEMERAISLRIRPPWWQSAWAYFAYTAAGGLLLWALIQWRTRALRERAAWLESGVEERTAQLVNQTRVIEDQARHLKQALATKERLFARVSHEFRTPLTLIVGPIDALLADERRGRTAGWLRLMRRNAQRLLLLVDQLLGLARLSGEAPILPTPQAIAPVVRGTVAAFQSIALAKSLSLTVERVDEAWAAATPELLERIVTNLVSNAVKYTPAGGHIRASVLNQGAMAVIAVADDGPGVPHEEQEAIFEPFHQAGAGGTGAGIGLALVRECAQAIGGSVTLESEPGHGATFSIYLPSCAPPGGDVLPAKAERLLSERMLLETEVAADAIRTGGEQADSLTPIIAAADDQRARVLIVEDNADLRVLLFATLTSAYRCTTAADGRSGVAAAVDDPPDLILSDVMMPGVDGFELTRRIKQDPRTSHVPVVLLTALGDRHSRLLGLEEHADDYLVKPFDADELRLRVRNLIEARQIAAQRAARGVYDEASSIAATDAADTITQSPRERAFLERLLTAAQAGYASSDFGVADLAGRVAMSERQLQRKLRAVLGVSPAEYLRELRLQRAAALLRAGQPAANVAFEVGFATPSHFGACFKARFGATPGDFRKHDNKL